MVVAIIHSWTTSLFLLSRTIEDDIAMLFDSIPIENSGISTDELTQYLCINAVPKKV